MRDKQYHTHPPEQAEYLGAMEPMLGHFTEDDLGDQGVVNELSGMLILGFERRLQLLSRIISRCEKLSDGCIVWSGSLSGRGRGRGYGRISVGGTTAAVHRIVYVICFGPIPSKRQIDHSCNRRNCCNPHHLSLVTHKKNQKLRDERARSDNL